MASEQRGREALGERRWRSRDRSLRHSIAALILLCVTVGGPLGGNLPADRAAEPSGSGTQPLPPALALVVHTGMATEERIAQLRLALRAFLDGVPPSVEILLLPFDESVQADLPLMGDRRRLRERIDRIRPGQGSDLYGAVNTVLDQLSPLSTRPRAILLLSDGVDWRTHSGIGEATLRRAEESRIPIHAIQLTTRPDAEEMVVNQREMLGQVDFGLIFGGPSSRKRRSPPPPPEPTELPAADGGTSRSSPPPVSPESRPAERQKDDPYKLPVPIADLPPPRGQRMPGPEADRAPQPGRLPPQPRGRVPEHRFPDATRPQPPAEPPTGGGGFPGTARARPDATREALDQLYHAADVYLTALTRLTGGSRRQVKPDEPLVPLLRTLAPTLLPTP
jgi:hypothetical protein